MGEREMRNTLLSATLFLSAFTGAAPAATIGFGGNGTGYTLTKGGGGNGPSVTGDVLTLTDANNSEGNAAFFNTPQSYSPFVANFVYQDVTGGGADGFTFTLQNDPRGPSAVGDGGGNLGYGGGAKITPSVATDFNLYSGNGGSKSGFTTNGTINYASTGAVDITSGHPIGVTILYDGTNATETLVDPIAGTTFTTSQVVGPLSAILGGSTAFVGFTGGTGGVNAMQTISGFTYSNVVPEPASLGFLGIAGLSLLARRRK
jgi:hypothetical protein